ncbi:MAG: 2-oxoacid:acceptor oxidoreductase family protein [Acidobacteria bacterium]|nr:2-oxoacid:acceptor oxidoreductase family protein [Acidobacteriota bacterium]
MEKTVAALIEVRWHSRAGQGAVTAAEMLAAACLREGKHVQAFPEFGPERMGAPLRAFNRISPVPIRIHGVVEEASVVVVVDPSLLGTVAVGTNSTPDAVIVVNTTQSPAEVHRLLRLSHQQVACVDATRIAAECFGMLKPNTPMLGAVARTTGLVTIESLLAEVEEMLTQKFSPKIVEGNLKAIQRAHEEVSYV